MVFSTNGAGTTGYLDIHMQKMNVDQYFIRYTKINSQWIKSLNVRAKTRKLLAENIGIKFNDLGLDSGLYQKHNEQQK